MAKVALLVLGLGAARAAAGEILLLTSALPFSHRGGCQTGKKLDSDPLYKQCQQNYAQVDFPRPDLHIMSIQCLWLKFPKLQFCLTRNLVHSLHWIWKWISKSQLLSPGSFHRLPTCFNLLLTRILGVVWLILRLNPSQPG